MAMAIATLAYFGIVSALLRTWILQDARTGTSPAKRKCAMIAPSMLELAALRRQR
jgi:hypothetical protein